MRKRTFDEEATLKKAMLLFWENGFENTSINDIESSTGVTRTSLYHAYGDKEGIFLRALDIYINSQYDHWIRIIKEDASLLEVLERFFDSVIAHNCATDTPTSCMIAVNSIALKRLSRTVQLRLKHYYSEVSHELEHLFEKNIQSGILQKELKAKDLSIYMLGSIQGIMLLSRAMDNHVDFEAIKIHTLAYIRSLVVMPD